MKKKMRYLMILFSSLGLFFMGNLAQAKNAEFTDIYQGRYDMYIQGGGLRDWRSQTLSMNGSIKAFLVQSGKTTAYVDGMNLNNGDKIIFKFKYTGEWFGEGYDIDSPAPHFLPASDWSYSKLQSKEICTDTSAVTSTIVGEDDDLMQYYLPMIIKYPKIVVKNANLDCDAEKASSDTQGEYVAEKSCTVKVTDVNDKIISAAMNSADGTIDYAQNACYLGKESCYDEPTGEYYWNAETGSYEAGTTKVCGWSDVSSYIDYHCTSSGTNHRKSCNEGAIKSHAATYNATFIPAATSGKLSYTKSCWCVNDPAVNILFTWNKNLDKVQEFKLFRKKEGAAAYELKETYDSADPDLIKNSSTSYSFQYGDHWGVLYGTKYDYKVVVTFTDGSANETYGPETVDDVLDCNGTPKVSVTPTDIKSDTNPAEITIKYSAANNKDAADSNGHGWYNKATFRAVYKDESDVTVQTDVLGVRSIYTTEKEWKGINPRLDVAKKIEIRGTFTGDQWDNPSCDDDVMKYDTVNISTLKPEISIVSDPICTPAGSATNTATGIQVNIDFLKKGGASKYAILKSKDLFDNDIITFPGEYNTCKNFSASPEAWLDSKNKDYTQMHQCYNLVEEGAEPADVNWNHIFKLGVAGSDNLITEEGGYIFYAFICKGPSDCSGEFVADKVINPQPKTCRIPSLNLQNNTTPVFVSSTMNLQWNLVKNDDISGLPQHDYQEQIVPGSCRTIGTNFNVNPIVSNPFDGSKDVTTPATPGTYTYHYTCQRKNTGNWLSASVNVNVKDQEKCGAASKAEPECSTSKPDSSLCKSTSNNDLEAKGSVSWDATNKLWNWDCNSEAGCQVSKCPIATCGSSLDKCYNQKTDIPDAKKCDEGTAGNVSESGGNFSWICTNKTATTPCGVKKCVNKGVEWQEVNP